MSKATANKITKKANGKKIKLSIESEKKPTPAEIQSAVMRITLPAIQRFIGNTEFGGPDARKSLSHVRACFHGAGGGFNQASWERLRITKTMTLDCLIEKLRCSELMKGYIKAWALIESAVFYAHLIQYNLETIELLIAVYGPDKLYSDLVKDQADSYLKRITRPVSRRFMEETLFDDLATLTTLNNVLTETRGQFIEVMGSEPQWVEDDPDNHTVEEYLHELHGGDEMESYIIASNRIADCWEFKQEIGEDLKAVEFLIQVHGADCLLSTLMGSNESLESR